MTLSAGKKGFSAFDPSFWKNRRVLVTGHTGFMGSWLCLWLEKLGAEIHGIALPPEPNSLSLYREAAVRLNGSDTFLDIRQQHEFKKKLQEISPEIVLHLAAQPLVLPSYQDPVGTMATNVMGTAHLLETLASQKGLSSVAIVTSDKCYRNEEQRRAFIESDPFGGDDPYSASKAAAEIVVSSFRKSFFKETPVLAFRAGNIIGGGDWSWARLVPDIMQALHKKDKLVIRSPEAVRPWQHVLEPIFIYLWMLQNSLNAGSDLSSGWNIGPDHEAEKKVIDVVKLCFETWQRPHNYEVIPPKTHEAHFLTLNSDKLRNATGWRPVLQFTETIQWTSQWYQSYYEKPSEARKLCLRQIDEFSERAIAQAQS